MFCEHMLFGDGVYCKKDGQLKSCTECKLVNPKEKYDLDRMEIKYIEGVYYHSPCNAEMNSIDIGIIKLERDADDMVSKYLIDRNKITRRFNHKITVGYECPICGITLNLIKED